MDPLVSKNPKPPVPEPGGVPVWRGVWIAIQIFALFLFVLFLGASATQFIYIDF